MKAFWKLDRILALLLCIASSHLIPAVATAESHFHAGYLEELGLRINWLSNQNGVLVSWRELGDGMPPDGSNLVSDVAIRATIAGEPVTEGVRAIPFNESGLQTATLVIFESRNAQYMLLQLDALGTLLSLQDFGANPTSIAVSHPKFQLIGEIAEDDQLKPVLERLPDYATAIEAKVTPSTVAFDALKAIAEKTVLRKNLIVSESQLASIPENQIEEFLRMAVSNNVTVYPLVMSRGNSNFGWPLDLAAQTGGRVLPWINEPPTVALAASALANSRSGGIATFPVANSYRTPGEYGLRAHLSVTRDGISTYFSAPLVIQEIAGWDYFNPASWIAWASSAWGNLYGIVILVVFIVLILAWAITRIRLKKSRFAELQNEASGDIHNIYSLPFVIGRGESVDLYVNCGEVSRAHAVIEKTSDGGYLLKDLSSLNGTFLGDKRIEEARLGDAETIGIGNQSFTFRSFKLP